VDRLQMQLPRNPSSARPAPDLGDPDPDGIRTRSNSPQGDSRPGPGHDVCTFAPGLHNGSANEKVGKSSPDREMVRLYSREIFFMYIFAPFSGSTGHGCRAGQGSSRHVRSCKRCKDNRGNPGKVPDPCSGRAGWFLRLHRRVQRCANVQRWCKDE
jgi:hypothetical protein